MSKTFYLRLDGNQMPYFGGHATMMRLPMRESAAGLVATFVGVPFDIGTSNRAVARCGIVPSCSIPCMRFRPCEDAARADSHHSVKFSGFAPARTASRSRP